MTKKVGYWISTGLLALAMLSGGMAELAQRRETLEGMLLLGSPAYFVSPIGFWKQDRRDQLDR